MPLAFRFGPKGFAPLIAAALASLTPASPALAQDNGTPGLQAITLGAVLGVCVKALDGQLDLNSVSQMDEWSLRVGTADEEAALRKYHPTLEIVEADFPDGSVILNLVPGSTCTVQIKGEGRFGARDALIRRMIQGGAHSERDVAEDGGEVLTFRFDPHPIYVLSTPEGSVAVQVR